MVHEGAPRSKKRSKPAVLWVKLLVHRPKRKRAGWDCEVTALLPLISTALCGMRSSMEQPQVGALQSKIYSKGPEAPVWTACCREGQSRSEPSKRTLKAGAVTFMAVSTRAGCSLGRVHDAAHLGSVVAMQRATPRWQQCTARTRKLTGEQLGKGCLRQALSERTLRCMAGLSLESPTVRLALLHRALLAFKPISTRLNTGFAAVGQATLAPTQNWCEPTCRLLQFQKKTGRAEAYEQVSISTCTPAQVLPGLSASCRLQPCHSALSKGTCGCCACVAPLVNI